MTIMKQVYALSMALAFCLSPVSAQDDTGDVTEGFDLMEEGAKLLMRGLMSEVAPAIEDLRTTLEDMGPELGEFITTMGLSLIHI